MLGKPHDTRADIPASWRLLPLREVVKEMADGGTPPRSEPNYFGGEIAWIVIDDIERHITDTVENLTSQGLGACSAKLWPTGSVILSTGATIGNVGITKVPAATKQGITGIVTDPEILNSQFLAAVLSASGAVLRSFAQGSTIQEIRPPVLGTLQILLPPLPEQKKIATILSSVDDAIAATRKVIEQTKRVNKGLLQDLMTRGIGHTRFKQTEIGEIPEEWEVVDLPALGAGDRPMVKAGPFGSALKKEYYTDSGYKIYGQEQVLEGDAAFGDYYIGEEKYCELETCAVQPGDVLVTLVGTPGKTLVLGEDIQDGVINPRLVRLSPDPDRVHPRFLSFYLESPLARKRLAKLSHGGTMDILNSKMLSSLEVPRPRIEEQQAIVEALDTVEKTVVRFQEAVTGLQTLKRGLMQDLLTGRVRVLVD